MRRYLKVLDDHSDVVVISATGVFRYWVETKIDENTQIGSIKFRLQCLRRKSRDNSVSDHYCQKDNEVSFVIKFGVIPRFESDCEFMILGD